ncbi:MAG: bifunctional methylenetetrahydrofolate dehydrogenase/methenyltetrahydrofolate cyclohydrolase FolD [Planctomycetota bacterium]|nr:bifunctional methylenetetrahydrofolate dehydrogenase/methenyltetrahydrofolate cyclohydrolase FolD [Planctomycetota bacterium]
MDSQVTNSNILDGKASSASILEQLKPRVAEIAKQNHGTPPGLATILVGEDPASHVYVRNKRRACENVGLQNFHYELAADAGQQKLLELVDELNNNPEVDGILVQLPLPKGFDYDESQVLVAINPAKDADGFHPVNQGALMQGTKAPVPCTPKGVMYLLNEVCADGSAKHAVVVGRSNIVGKPVAMLLLSKNFTVTMCHSRTADLASEVARADVVVAAVGVAKLIKGEWVKPGAIVLDVGINRTEDGKLVGDVDFASACQKASHITPVPGGVGPMTIAMLLSNTVEAAEQRLGINA